MSHTAPLPDPALVLTWAKEDHDSVLELTQALVRIPSRAGIDPYEAIITALSTWMRGHHLTPRILHDASGAPVAITADITGTRPGPRWVLDACLDTAPYGDETAWTHPPASGHLQDGWLWGRGSSDSKAAVAVFCHIAARLTHHAEHLHGTLTLLFDLDEHTGGFGGAKRYFHSPDAPTDVAGVMIGYPGTDHLVIGGRGVHRAQVHVRGHSSHSGGSKTTPNAIDKAAHLIRELHAERLPDPGDDFPLPGKVTVTAITAGQGYSVTPDLCTLNIDIRTTPAFDDTAAAELRIRPRCPECRLMDKAATDLRITADDHAIHLDSACPHHGTYRETIDIHGTGGWYDANTPIRSIQKGYLLAAERDTHHACPISIDGADWGGAWHAHVLAPALALLGIPPHRWPVSIFTPMILDRTGGKLSKTLYVRYGRDYTDLPGAFLDLDLLLDHHGDHALTTLWNEARRWAAEPARLHRSYTTDYLTTLLSGAPRHAGVPA
ncbi:M20 family metallopeptidase [Streptomyces specialis]|uniref:M20 family metallopeptidase n=1 Tax=Streptomyces specialis TaxID=498367 RepID=UPI00099ED727|nr:M20/M25/M40 family metallo-hydrolase [Streptomyces specialis]